MAPIAGRLGPLVFYSFTAVLATGILLGFGLAAIINKRRPIPGWPDALLAGLALALLAGRAGFVWFRWDYYGARPFQIIQFWQGGLSYHGALLGGLAGVWWWGRRQGWSLTDTAALTAPLLPLLSGMGWLACWLAGCAYGRPAPLGWLTADLPDEFGLYAVRTQTQLLGMAAALLIFFWLWRRRKQWPPLRQFVFALGGLSLAHGGIGFLRGDTAVHLQFLRLDTVLDFLVVCLALVLLKYGK
ncbi:MAG: prolipoprotein diacylglyceryl transferase family protein [Anaerolineae bacterium]